MKILVSPLDWGLGHATRLIPIINWLIDHKHEIIISGSGNSLEILKKTFPNLKAINLKSFSPWYNSKIGVAISILIQIPKFLYCIYREQKATKRIVKKNNIDLIISDNRYGVRSSLCKSYIITHQLSPKCGIKYLSTFEPLLACILASFINKFNKCLIPDIKPFPDGLSGELSNPRYIKIPIQYIGILSHLTNNTKQTNDETPITWLGIISGQEPHRTLFEKEITEIFRKKEGRRVIVCGKITNNNQKSNYNGIEIYPYLKSNELSKTINLADNIICRAGYSTIMDMYALNKKATFIPTPNQAEQEYLAKNLKEHPTIQLFSK